MRIIDLPPLGFRTLQAAKDLCAAAHRQPEAARHLIADNLAELNGRQAGIAALSRVIDKSGCRVESRDDLALLQALQAAVRNPKTDSVAFVLAAATLLANRLQHGLGDTDLAAVWERFRQIHTGLNNPDRAAIVQGFTESARLGYIELPPNASPSQAYVTRNAGGLREELLVIARRDTGALSSAIFERLDSVSSALAQQHLLALLAGKVLEPLTGDSMLFDPLLAIASHPRHPAHVAATALLLAEALRTSDQEGWFGVTLWPELGEHWLALEAESGHAVLAGLRHLYESDPLWAADTGPSPDTPDLAPVALLPVLDESFVPDQSGAHVD